MLKGYPCLLLMPTCKPIIADISASVNDLFLEFWLIPPTRRYPVLSSSWWKGSEWRPISGSTATTTSQHTVMDGIGSSSGSCGKAERQIFLIQPTGPGRELVLGSAETWDSLVLFLDKR